MANLITGNFADSVKTLYAKRLLINARHRMQHAAFRDETGIPNGNGSIEFRTLGELDTVSTPLSEGVTPDETNQPSMSTVTLTPEWYGAWVKYTDVLKVQEFDPIIESMAGRFGYSAGLSFDTIIRDVLAAGCSTIYSGSAESRVTVTAGRDTITYADFLKGRSQMDNNLALPRMGGTTHVCIMHPHTWETLMQDPTFVTLFTREGGENIRKGYIGTVLDTEIYLSGNAKTYADSGASSADVYLLLFIGLEAYAVVGMAGEMPNLDAGSAGGEDFVGTGQEINSVQIISKDLGETGFDPLNQRGTVGWRASLDSSVLQTNFLVGLEHATVRS